MKNKILKYIFTCIVVGLTIFLIYHFYNKNENAGEDIKNEVSEETSTGPSNLRIGISNLDTLNPLISKNQNIQDISKLMFEPLFNVSDNFRLEKCLALEFSKADSKTYFVKLRENVKWHNGADFLAQDVKYTIETIKVLGEASIYYSNVKDIESVEIVNDNLIKIYLNQEMPFFEYNLTFPIISSSVFGLDSNILNSDKNNLPIGTGKYKLQSIDITSQMELKENKNWWNSENKALRIDSITIRIYQAVSEVYNAYKLGRIRLDNFAKFKCRR